MAAEEKWYFTKEQLANTPSRKCGYDVDRELSCRQHAANFIQDMGQRLQVTQLCINTAIVYMHRFYVFHSFTQFHRNSLAVASLFLAAKVEEQPRKLEHVIKIAQMCLHRETTNPIDVKSEQYLEQAQDLVMNENVLLQTLGFDVAIDHPHTHVVRCCHLVKASKDLAQTSYFMASNSLHLTTMCLMYKPTVVACFCIHLACKWSNWEIPQSHEGKPWFYYIDRSVTQELLDQLTAEFLVIFDKCPSRLKRKIMAISANQNPTLLAGYPFATSPHNRNCTDGDKNRPGEGAHQSTPTFPPPQAVGEDGKKRLDGVSQAERLFADFKKLPLGTQHHRESSHGSQGLSSYVNNSTTSKHSNTGGMFPPPTRVPGPVQHPLHPARPPSNPTRERERERKLEKAGHHLPRNGTHSSNIDIKPSLNDLALSMQSYSAKKLYDAPRLSVNETKPVPWLTSDVVVKEERIETNSVSVILKEELSSEHNLVPPMLVPPPPPPPTPVKVERSIFSPEKRTPPSGMSESKTCLNSPPPSTPGNTRNRTSSSSSEAELVLVMPKLEEISGFESLAHGNMSIKLPGKVPDLIQPVKDKKPDCTDKEKEVKHPDLLRPSIKEPSIEHKEHKKKKKHKEHKEHKDKEREHRKKHKHREKHKDPAPIKITIPKDKLTLPAGVVDSCLKIKIPKDRLTSSSPSGLKIKISKDVIKDSKKRERSGDRCEGPPSKRPPNGTRTLQGAVLGEPGLGVINNASSHH